MKLGKGMKLFIGALTAWPIAYIPIFVGFIVWTMMQAQAQGPGPQGPPIAFFLLFAAHGFTMVVIMGLLVFYIVHIMKNPEFDDTKRILWVLLIFMGNMIAMPIYFVMFVWKEKREVLPPVVG